VFHQTDGHQAAMTGNALSVVIFSHDFNAHAASTTWRDQFDQKNTEALCLLPRKAILDEICIRYVQFATSASSSSSSTVKH
jgi:hypothetical protein